MLRQADLVGQNRKGGRVAKAKKPASTRGPATDKAVGNVPKNAGSMPKTTRSKAAGMSETAAKKESTPAKAATTPTPATSKAPEKTPEPVKKTPEPVNMSDPKPASEKSTATPDPSAAKPSEQPKSDAPKVESKSAPAPTPKPAKKKSGSAFWPLVFGGVIAAALGFFAAEMNLLGTRDNNSDLRTQLNDQQAQIVELQNAKPQVPEMEFPELGGLTSDVAALSETLSAMETRLTEVEKRPISEGTSPAAVAAYERELEALQASVEEQRSEIEGLLDNALSVEEATADMARTATLQAALTSITAAINGGQPFASELSELEANGMSDIPAALTNTADTGVVTLINLQTRFPDAARTALSVARADGTDEAAGGVSSFLRRQLGARSVAPREGSGPDAVLSRAEAAVRDGELADALSELDTLPENAKAAMQDWLADARARQAADAAAQDLSQRLTAN